MARVTWVTCSSSVQPTKSLHEAMHDWGGRPVALVECGYSTSNPAKRQPDGVRQAAWQTTGIPNMSEFGLVGLPIPSVIPTSFHLMYYSRRCSTYVVETYMVSSREDHDLDPPGSPPRLQTS